MSSSLYGGLVRSQDSLWSDYSPADTVFVRGLFNNACHLADQSAQVVCNWRTTTNYVIRDRDAALNELGVYASTYPIWASQPFCLRFREDGSSYRVRVRVRARLDAAGSNRLRIALVGKNNPGSYVDDPRSLTYSMSSTTEAWLSSPISGGDGNGNVYIPSAGEVLTDRATLDELSGSPTIVRWTPARIVVYAVPPGGGTTPIEIRLYGVHAAEYYGT